MPSDKREGEPGDTVQPGAAEEGLPRGRGEVPPAALKGPLPSARFQPEMYAARRGAARAGTAAEEIVGFAFAADPGAAPRPGVSPARHSPNPVEAPRANVDAVVVSHSGAFLVVGWADTRSCPIATLQVNPLVPYHREVQGARLVRFRRPDAESALGLEEPHLFGFSFFASTGFDTRRLPNAGSCAVEMRFSSGAGAVFAANLRIVDDRTLRDLAIGYLANMQFFGNATVEAFYALDGGLGDELILHNAKITKSIVSSAVCERFGAPPANCKGSIVVCLYGKPEYQFIQNALFSLSASFTRDYEFIYVSNSPELAETLYKIGDIGREIYGVSVAVVMLTGNAGFGAANNVAAGFASSKRVIILNPDVFPKDPGWAEKHERLIDELPEDQTRIFGAKLFYADGSLMHGGMYLERDWGISIDNSEIRRRPILRVQHYGKGASPQLAAYAGSRRVPAVTGAFISIEKAWFETLNGFSESYIFGHYEDADLCLRSGQKGVVPWVHDIEMWHLEGKGSTRLPLHDGASMVNRWRFSGEWHERLGDDLIGPAPRLPAATGEGAAGEGSL